MSGIHRVGPVDIQHFDVHVTSTVPTYNIAVGDLVAAVSSKAVPAHGIAWDTDLVTTQTAFAAAFLGASESRSRLGNTDPRDLRIAANMDGTYDFSCVSANFTVGQYVGAAKDTGNALLSGVVVGVASKALAIGVVVEAGTALTTVRIRLINTIAKR